jgi:hypothetical protein
MGRKLSSFLILPLAHRYMLYCYQLDKTYSLTECIEMTKRIDRFSDWIGAADAAQLLSEKMARPIPPKYIRSLSKSRRQPIRTQVVSNRLMYFKPDLLDVNIRQKTNKHARLDKYNS